MLSVRKLNIKNKLMAIIMIVSIITVMLPGVIFIGFSVHAHKIDLAQDLTGLAGVIGNNCKVILEFNFPEDADKVLKSLDARDSIVFARIYDKDMNILSTYHKKGTIAPEPENPPIDDYLYENNALHVFRHVRLDDKIIGTVYLQDNVKAVYDRMKRDTIALFLFIFISLIIAYFISSFLQKMISGPILSLSEIAKTVSQKKDYALRATKENEDEIGQLIDSFNTMLEKIQNHHIAISESEERFKLALRGGDMGMWDWNLSTDHVIFSDRWANMLGYDINDLEPTSKTWEKLLHPDDRKDVIATLEDTLEGKILFFESEFRLKTKSGSYKWILSRGMVFERDNTGNPIRAVGTHLDITERKVAEKERKERDEKIRAILSVNPDLLFVMGENGEYLDIFTGSTDLLVAPREKLIGNTIHDVLPVEISAGAQATIDKTLAYSRPQIFEYQVVINGNPKWFSARTAPFKHQNRNCVLWSARDNTEFRLAEEERINMEKRLLQAQKMESIGTLAGGIAHDFNNILGIIIGNTELAMDEVPEWNPARISLDEIKIAGLRAKDLVQQLLNFSRKSDEKRKPIPITLLVKDALKLLRSTIPANIEILQNIMDESATVMADPIQMHQVIMNICTNASHAMAEKGGVMEISVSTEEIDRTLSPHTFELRSGRYVKITICDTGYGIAPHNLDKVFDPYFTTKAFGEGSGIGLSVVHGIIKNHRGTIWVESDHGKGAMFTILLPVEKSLPQTEELKEAELKPGKEKILFVDDEHAIVDLAMKMLGRLGYEVTGEYGSIEALETFKEKPQEFDLIISDMSMPKMTGDQFVEAVREIRRDIPIILCTGFSDRMDDKRAREIGISALIMKPIIKTEITQTIRRVLDGIG